MNIKKTAVIAGVSIALISVCTYSYLSPYFAVRAIGVAAKDQDTDALNELVDFPAVRESLKATLNAKLAKNVGELKSDNPFAGFGAMLVQSLVNSAVDAMVTPSGMIGVMNGKVAADGKPPTGEIGKPMPLFSSEADGVQRELSYKSFNRFQVRTSNTATPDTYLTLHMRREGAFSWKLHRIEMGGL